MIKKNYKYSKKRNNKRRLAKIIIALKFSNLKLKYGHIVIDSLISIGKERKRKKCASKFKHKYGLTGPLYSQI